MNGLSGMVYNGENYYYVKNTLGDIIAIRNSAGTEVASYNYDAWGNVIVKSGTMADINPFRYRGYYYDVETGFYYLQTRYYDPTTRLFINADNYELLATLAEIPGQLNMYGYCNNNPIMFTDETGEVILSTIVVGAVIGGALSFTSSVIEQVAVKGWDTSQWDWAEIGLSTLVGALSGAVAGSSLGLGAQIAINAGLGALQETASQIDSGDINVLDILTSAAASGLAGAAGGNGVHYVGKSLKDIIYYKKLVAGSAKVLIKLSEAIFKGAGVNEAYKILKYKIGG